MKSKIKKILLETLSSNYDNGNIDDGGIGGGDNAVDQLYDLFVDEATNINEHQEEYEKHMKSTNSAVIKLNNEFSPTLEDEPQKVGEIKYTNPKTGKPQKLFDTLIPVFMVCCRNDNAVKGYKGCAVYIAVEAADEEEAKNKAMKIKNFTNYLELKYFNRKMLDAYKPTGNYVIGKVNYYEGDERL